MKTKDKCFLVFAGVMCLAGGSSWLSCVGITCAYLLGYAEGRLSPNGNDEQGRRG